MGRGYGVTLAFEVWITGWIRMEMVVCWLEEGQIGSKRESGDEDGDGEMMESGVSGSGGFRCFWF